MRPRVKICCMGSVAEMRLAVRYGAAAVGLVSAMPSGPGVIADELIAEIAAQVPPCVASFLLTCKNDVEEIIEQQRRLRPKQLPSPLPLVDQYRANRSKQLTQACRGLRARCSPE